MSSLRNGRSQLEPGAEQDSVELFGVSVGEGHGRRPRRDVIHGRTVIRPSATSGRYCWARVTPAANSDGSGAGAPYCSGLPPASTTISLSCRSTSASGKSFVRQRSVPREDPVVGRHSRGELRQYVPLSPLGHHDARRAELGQFGGDFERADGAARDENALAEVGKWLPVVVCGHRSCRAAKVSSPGTAGI